MKFVLAAFGILMSVPALASNPFNIVIKDVSGLGCPSKDAVSVELDPATGLYNIVASFNEKDDYFTAESSPDITSKRSNCIIDYDLVLTPGYKLDYAQFEIDGQYNLSETGTAFLSIRHAVPGIADPTYHNLTKTYSLDDPDGNFVLYGSIEGIDERVNYCGATIPLQVQVRATARQARSDQLSTFVAVDNADGDVFAASGTRKIKCEAKPIVCH